MLPKLTKPDPLTLFRVGSLTFYALLFIFLPNINNLSPRKASRLCPDNQTSVNTESSGQSNDISFGETSFIKPEKNPSSERQEGIDFRKEKKYEKAKNKLETAINNNRNDPEASIFLNNINIILNNANNNYTIAVTVPDNKQIALEILRGVAQAQDEINKSPDGMNGKKLKVAIAYEKDKSKAKEIASALVNKEEVLGVVGHFTSDATKEAGTVYCGKLVAISPTSTSVKLENQINPYIFTTVPSDAVQARALAEYMARTLKKKKAVVFYNSDSGYSVSLKSELETAISLEGGEVLNKQKNQQEFDVNSMPGTPDTSLNKARELGAEVLISALDSDSFDKAASLAQQQPEFTLLGGDALYRKNTLEWKQAPNEIVVAAPWHKELSDKTLTFSKNAKELWGTEDVNWRTALAYDATQAFIEALKKNQNQNPTREDVKKALSDKDFSSPNGASGPIRFLPSGERNAPFQLVKVFPNKNGEYNFCPIQNLKLPDKCDTLK